MHSPNTFPVPFIHVDKTNSTNSYLQQLCSMQKVEEFTTLLAGFQTAGRGQRGNSWESDSGKNLLFSFVLFPKFLEARCQFLISQIVSLAIKETLDAYTHNVSIKWPNDIYWKDKKICGMLIENELMGKNICQSIAGVGININQEEFRSSAPNPISLLQIIGKECNLLDILINIMERVKHYYTLSQQKQIEVITSRYSQALFRRSGFHLYKDIDGEFLARIIQVEPDGRLILENEAGEVKKYLFKEVEYIIHK